MSRMASTLMDRITLARARLAQLTQDGRHPWAVSLTLAAALAVAMGIVRLAVDDTVALVALPEPAPNSGQLSAISGQLRIREPKADR